MDIREVSYLMMIAKEQNLTKAANRLFLTQPALSKFLKEKEIELGVKLFERIDGKYTPTYAGRKYLERSVEIMDLKKKLDDEISQLAKTNAGELKIAFPIMRGSYLIHKTIPVFHKIYPNVEIIIKEQPSGLIEEMLTSGEIDIAFFNDPVASSDLSYEHICTEELVLVVPHDHPSQKYAMSREGCSHQWIDINHFKNDNFVMQLYDQRSRLASKQAFESTGFTPKSILTIRNIGATIKLATEGFGLCVVSDVHPQNIHLSPKPLLFAVGEPPVKMEFLAVYRKNGYLTDFAKKYIEIVRESAISLQNEVNN